MSRKLLGYTLIELMVVVAIIGIIAAVAYPSYQSYTCDTFRSQAVVDMKICALAMDKYYGDGFTYVGATIDDSADTVCSDQSPSDGRGMFDLTLPTKTVNNYLIRATPSSDNQCDHPTLDLVADGTLTEN